SIPVRPIASNVPLAGGDRRGRAVAAGPRDSKRMTKLWRCLLASACVAASSGCNPQFTRVPDLVPRTNEQDRRLWNYFDPFPDHTTGPTTDHRPAGGNIQRTMPRQALEKDSQTFPLRGPADPPRPEARLNPKTADVVQP